MKCEAKVVKLSGTFSLLLLEGLINAAAAHITAPARTLTPTIKLKVKTSNFLVGGSAGFLCEGLMIDPTDDYCNDLYEHR